MKKTALKKKSKTKISTLKNKLWSIVSKKIRERDKYICITCGKKGEGSGIHAGHFIPDAVSGALLRYHPDNIHAQCYNCNINLGGWGEKYADVLEYKKGREFINALRLKRMSTIKADEFFYLTMIELYNRDTWELDVVTFINTI